MSDLPLTVEGGCHCGSVRYGVTIRSLDAVICNCSVCTMKGFVHIIVTDDDFELLSGVRTLQAYRFNTGVAKHLFCGTCGVHSFYVPRSHPDGFSVNLRCLDKELWPRFRLVDFDGRNWEASIDNLA